MPARGCKALLPLTWVSLRAQLVKKSACNAGDPSSIPGLGRSPEEGKGYPLQYSGLENSMDTYSPWGRKESDTTERLSLSLSPYLEADGRAVPQSSHLFPLPWSQVVLTLIQILGTSLSKSKPPLFCMSVFPASLSCRPGPLSSFHKRNHERKTIDFIIYLFEKVLAVPWDMWDLCSLSWDRSHTLCIGRQSLNHWTTRKVPRRKMTAFVSGSHSCGGCGVTLGRIVSSTWVLGPGCLSGAQGVLEPRASHVLCVGLQEVGVVSSLQMRKLKFRFESCPRSASSHVCVGLSQALRSLLELPAWWGGARQLPPNATHCSPCREVISL